MVMIIGNNTDHFPLARSTKHFRKHNYQALYDVDMIHWTRHYQGR